MRDRPVHCKFSDSRDDLCRSRSRLYSGAAGGESDAVGGLAVRIEANHRKARSIFEIAQAFSLFIERLLFDFARTLFAVALTSKSFLGAPLLAWFQVERVPLDFLNNVLLLNLAFEAAQRTFKSFALLQMDFCQLRIHHLPVISVF